ncbi:hypothetical protein TNCV_4567221 [Trichonephila clavipes]|nr:hypothetical protein TNCV_4567221 [Trichonephila clavipes]
MDFLSAILQKDLAGMYPLCIIKGNSGQGMVLPHKDPVLGGSTEREDRNIRRKDVAHPKAGRNSSCIWSHSDTANCCKSVTSRTVSSQAPHSVYSTDSKPLLFTTPVVSKLSKKTKL